MNVVYLNGHYLPQEKAAISIMDRGFLFGDSIYEVIPVFHGQFFGLTDHLARLQHSLDAVHIRNPHTASEWEAIFKKLLQKNNVTSGDFSCYLHITRGVESTRHHLYQDNLTPTVVAFITALKSKTIEQLEKGFSAITHVDTRHHNCHIKSTNLLPNILLAKKAESVGAIEVILLRDGYATECTSSNLFIVKNNQLLTPPLSQYILGGVTRSLLLKLAKENHIPCAEQNITEAMLREADEIWVSGSIKELCPIVRLDNKPVGNGTAGSLWKEMYTLYEQEKTQHG